MRLVRASFAFSFTSWFSSLVSRSSSVLRSSICSGSFSEMKAKMAVVRSRIFGSWLVSIFFRVCFMESAGEGSRFLCLVGVCRLAWNSLRSLLFILAFRYG